VSVIHLYQIVMLHMKKTIAVASLILIGTHGFGQVITFDPIQLEKEQKNLSAIKGIFSDLTGMYIDENVERHLYTNLSRLNYCMWEPFDSCVMASYYSLADESSTFYGEANIFGEHNLLKDLRDVKITSVSFESPYHKENRTKLGYVLFVQVNYEKDNSNFFVHISFTIADGGIMLISIMNRPEEY
jgi:hypothetical protein